MTLSIEGRERRSNVSITGDAQKKREWIKMLWQSDTIEENLQRSKKAYHIIRISVLKENPPLLTEKHKI